MFAEKVFIKVLILEEVSVLNRGKLPYSKKASLWPGCFPPVLATAIKEPNVVEEGPHSGKVKGRAFCAQHDQHFSNLNFFHVNSQLNICVYVDYLFDLILTKASTLYFIQTPCNETLLQCACLKVVPKNK